MSCRNCSSTIAPPKTWRRPCCRCSRTRRSGGGRSRRFPGSTRSWRSDRTRRPHAPPISCLAPPGVPCRKNKSPAEPVAPSLAARDRHVVALGGAGIELARAADLLVRVFDHFLPLTDPADRAREREQHGEHGGREAHRHVEQRVVLDAELAQYLVTGLLHDLRARVVVLVDPVAKAHEAEGIVLI